MRLGVNALFLRPGRVGGTETYLRGFLQAVVSRPEVDSCTVFASPEFAAASGAGGDKLEWALLPFSAERRGLRLGWEQFIMPWQVRRRRLDLIFSPGYTAPLVSPCPGALLLPDLHYLDRPRDLPLLDGLAHRLLAGAAARRASLLVVLSEAMKESLARHYPRLARRTVVCPPPGPDFQPRRSEEDELLLVNIATTHPHKNQELLVEVMELLESEYRLRPRLWILGISGFARDRLLRRIARSPAGRRIELTLNAPSPRLEEALGRAALFLFPTLYEGYGLAPLEALARGVPVLASDLPVTREVLGEGADYCPPRDAAAWARAVAELLTLPAKRQALSERGRRWLARPGRLAGEERLWQSLLALVARR